MIGIIGAMDVEIEMLLENMEHIKKTQIGGREFFSGRLGNKSAVVARSGIGKVAAAVCAQTLIDRFEVTAVINTGIAGGIADELAVGDIVVSTSAVQHDFDVSKFGYAKGYMCCGGDHTRPTQYEADKKLRELVLLCAQEQLTDNRAHEGIIATGDIFVADAPIKRRIADEFGASATEMEGGAIAQTCVLNGVPFVIIRAISDLADGSASESYEQFERKAAENSAKIVMSAVKNY